MDEPTESPPEGRHESMWLATTYDHTIQQVTRQSAKPDSSP